MILEIELRPHKSNVIEIQFYMVEILAKSLETELKTLLDSPKDYLITFEELGLIFSKTYIEVLMNGDNILLL